MTQIIIESRCLGVWGVVGQKGRKTRGDQFKQIQSDRQTKLSALSEKRMSQIPVKQRIKSSEKKKDASHPYLILCLNAKQSTLFYFRKVHLVE